MPPAQPSDVKVVDRDIGSASQQRDVIELSQHIMSGHSHDSMSLNSYSSASDTRLVSSIESMLYLCRKTTSSILRQDFNRTTLDSLKEFEAGAEKLIVKSRWLSDYGLEVVQYELSESFLQERAEAPLRTSRRWFQVAPLWLNYLNDFIPLLSVDSVLERTEALLDLASEFEDYLAPTKSVSQVEVTDNASTPTDRSSSALGDTPSANPIPQDLALAASALYPLLPAPTASFLMRQLIETQQLFMLQENLRATLGSLLTTNSPNPSFMPPCIFDAYRNPSRISATQSLSLSSLIPTHNEPTSQSTHGEHTRLESQSQEPLIEAPTLGNREYSPESQTQQDHPVVSHEDVLARPGFEEDPDHDDFNADTFGDSAVPIDSEVSGGFFGFLSESKEPPVAVPTGPTAPLRDDLPPLLSMDARLSVDTQSLDLSPSSSIDDETDRLFEQVPKKVVDMPKGVESQVSPRKIPSPVTSNKKSVQISQQSSAQQQSVQPTVTQKPSQQQQPATSPQQTTVPATSNPQAEAVKKVETIIGSLDGVYKEWFAVTNAAKAAQTWNECGPGCIFDFLEEKRTAFMWLRHVRNLKNLLKSSDSYLPACLSLFAVSLRPKCKDHVLKTVDLAFSSLLEDLKKDELTDIYLGSVQSNMKTGSGTMILSAAENAGVESVKQAIHSTVSIDRLFSLTVSKLKLEFQGASYAKEMRAAYTQLPRGVYEDIEDYAHRKEEAFYAQFFDNSQVNDEMKTKLQTNFIAAISKDEAQVGKHLAENKFPTLSDLAKAIKSKIAKAREPMKVVLPEPPASPVVSSSISSPKGKGVALVPVAAPVVPVAATAPVAPPAAPVASPLPAEPKKPEPKAILRRPETSNFVKPVVFSSSSSSDDDDEDSSTSSDDDYQAKKVNRDRCFRCGGNHLASLCRVPMELFSARIRQTQAKPAARNVNILRRNI